MPLSKEMTKKLEAIEREIKKQDVKLEDENLRFAHMMNDKRYQEVDIEEFKKHYSRGDKIADQVAKVGGSWGFVISFITFLVVWMTINVLHLMGLFFDPYPFILLNLALSCISALQAPIIMMSQNRQSTLDSLIRDNDGKVNKKAEAELKLVHSKLDHLDKKLNGLIRIAKINAVK